MHPFPRWFRRSLVVALCLGALGGGALVAAEVMDGPDAVTTTTTTTTAPSTTSTAEPTTTTTSITMPPTTTTTVPTTTTTVPPEPEPTMLRRGAEGPEVLSLQERLLALGFWMPAPDGRYGALTEQAVLAFQKYQGLGRDGVAGPATLAALETATPAAALEAGDHVEIDLARQVLTVVAADRTFVFNTSTGTSGWETPPGRFTVTRQIDGLRQAELGDLWRPKYFNGGIAMHGSGSIPAYPASHGCARLSNAAIDLLWDAGLAPIGTPILVY